MHEKTLLKISFLGSLLGLLALYFLTQVLDYEEVSIKELNERRFDAMIKVKGRVESIHHGRNVSFISISEPCTLEAVAFADLPIEKGQNVEIIGKQDGEDLRIQRLRTIS